MLRAGKAFGAAALLALFGCSSGGSAPPAAAPAAGGLCSRLTATINDHTKSSWAQPQQTDNGPVHQCHWTAAAGKALAVQVADGESHIGFRDQQALVVHANGSVHLLRGLGSEAYTQVVNGTSLVAARDGAVGITVQLQGGTADDAILVARAILSATH